MDNTTEKTTIYEVAYLGLYYYTRVKPPETDKSFLVQYITGLVDKYPIGKIAIAKRLGVKSTSLIIIRYKKK